MSPEASLTGTPGTLRLAIDADPVGLTPASRDPASELLATFLYESLLRLDDRLVPVPELASGEPAVSEDGLTWTVPLAQGVVFHDDSALTAADVVASFALATASRCPYREDVCTAAVTSISRVAASEDGGAVVFTLGAPTASFGATVLAGVPILPSAAVAASLERFLAAAAAVAPEEARDLAMRIDVATNDPACLEPEPPDTCDPASYAGEIEALLDRAGVEPLDRGRFATDSGEVDEAGYAAALAERLDLFAAALAGAEAERTAAALPLLDLNRRPVGSGRYRLGSATPGDGVELRSFAAHRDRAPRAPAVLAVVVPDPAIASTALKTGELDWLPAVPADEVPALEGETAVLVAPRPDTAYRALVFNVRAGRPYADPAARAAFLACIDRVALVDLATGGRGVPATALTWPDSWAGRAAPFSDPERDPAGARRLLAAGGWTRDTDGLWERDGVRLSSELLIRPGRSDLLAFASGAAEQLGECGIELRVREAALSSDDLIRQLEWPNDFDTLLTTVRLATDPDTDFGLLHSSRATSETNPGDRNVGGFADPAVDELLVTAAAQPDREARAVLYGRLAERLSELAPVVPIWYETSWSAVSRRIVRADGDPVDPEGSRYAWDAPTWRVETN
jgi:ABC-type transport system substrate-binding protein